jgi:ferredoxin
MSVTVVVCGDHPQIPIDGPDTVVVDGLCKNPGQIRGLDVPWDRVVAVVHRNQYHLPDVQKSLRSVDVDPLGAQILSTDGETDATALGVTVEGLRARAEAFKDSAPEHAKPVFQREVTRRGFLKPPVPAYVSAPRVDHASCAADGGCRACVDVCPQGAYRWQAGRIAYDKNACVPCGRCVTTCPTGAIENPAVSPAMLAAQVTAVVAAAEGTIGIRFVCSRGRAGAREGWTDISVPCTSMVPGSWLLACLLLGAGAAHAVPCSNADCPLDLDASAIQANDLAHAVLAESGLDPTMVVGESVCQPLAHGLMDDPFEPGRAADVMVALAAIADTEIDVRHPAANTGVVEIDPAACTLCGQCAKTCPTDSLVEFYDDTTVTISFDAKTCVNCTQCVSACPEIARGAISVTGRIDVALLTAGRQTLNQGAVAMCEVCGTVIAPATMMSRIGDLLGEEFEATLAVLGNRCLDCRGRR